MKRSIQSEVSTHKEVAITILLRQPSKLLLIGEPVHAIALYETTGRKQHTHLYLY